MKKLWPFLLLNVVVSAATVLIVLLIWSSAHPAPSYPAGGISATVPEVKSTSLPTATLPPMGQSLFKIDAVYGSGDLENEYVHFIYLGSDPLNLLGWQVKDGAGHSYTFPVFIIYKNGAFDLYSKSGSSSTIELYMGQTGALWNSGTVVTLLDPAGNTRLTYKIP